MYLFVFFINKPLLLLIIFIKTNFQENRARPLQKPLGHLERPRTQGESSRSSSVVKTGWHISYPVYSLFLYDGSKLWLPASNSIDSIFVKVWIMVIVMLCFRNFYKSINYLQYANKHVIKRPIQNTRITDQQNVSLTLIKKWFKILVLSESLGICL